ncbi:MAG: DUF350 domain-containing protein [Nitrospirae bacterium]|nr:DUF350 domain-containing protein [Nitrospirota bacterium]MBF0535172.1 DUF350 domain-containing protein [Nitrospirota bacterium]MBF0615209.1 DUF350 domain-containing protein [Nitrospirota bacterium]
MLINGLKAFMSYFISSVVFLFLFSIIYKRITPYNEFKLIHEGNTAAALSFSGALIGFVLPMASAITHSADLLDMFIWAGVALVVQVISFLAVRLVFPTLVNDISSNQVSTGMFLGVISMLTGILNAACIS